MLGTAVPRGPGVKIKKKTARRKGRAGCVWSPCPAGAGAGGFRAKKNLRGLPKNPLIATGVKRTLSGDAARRRARNERSGRAGVGGQHL